MDVSPSADTDVDVAVDQGSQLVSCTGQANPCDETLVGLESQSPDYFPVREHPVRHGSDLAHGLPPPGKHSSGAVSTGGPASNGFPPPGKRSSGAVSTGGPASNSVTYLSGDDEPRQYAMDSSAPLDAPSGAPRPAPRAYGAPYYEVPHIREPRQFAPLGAPLGPPYGAYGANRGR